MVAPALTAVNIDIKAAGEAEHRRLTGASLGPVWDCHRAIPVGRRMGGGQHPLIPGTSADPARSGHRRAAGRRSTRTCRGTCSGSLRISGYAGPRLPHRRPCARRATPGTNPGSDYVYVERALGPEGRITKCPKCLIYSCRPRYMGNGRRIALRAAGVRAVDW